MGSGKTVRTTIALAMILLLAVSGIILTSMLTLRESNAAILGAVCGPTGGCERVLTSRYSHIHGIPLAAIGLVYYAVMVVLWCAVNGSRPGQIRAVLLWAALLLALAAASISAGLMAVQLRWIHSICPLCVSSAIDCAAIFVIMLYIWRHKDFGSQPLAAAVGMIMLVAMGAAAWLIILPSQQHIVGRVGGQVITADEMDRELGLSYRNLQWQSYRMQSNWVHAKLGTIVLGKEAAALGLSTAELVHQKVDQEVNDRIDSYVLTQHSQASQEEIAAFRQETFPKLDDPARAKYINDLIAKYGGIDYLPLPLITEDDLAAVPGWHRGADPATAKARLVVFADFTCEVCAQMAPILNDVMAKYGNQVSWTFKYLPHPAHEFSMDAAIAAECAGRQGKFWEYHDALMKHGGNLTGVDFGSLAVQLDLDIAAFTQCQGSDSAKQAVQKSRDQADSMGLSATPVVFLNGKRIGGLIEESELTRQIRALLAN
jgi:protein-disulfide isomerase/uncharacterized membrane protein